MKTIEFIIRFEGQEIKRSLDYEADVPVHRVLELMADDAQRVIKEEAIKLANI